MSVQGINSVVATMVADENQLNNQKNAKDSSPIFINGISSPKVDAKTLAQSLVNDISGLGTGKDFLYHIEQLTKENVVDVLSHFKNITATQGKEESLLRAIYSEAWFSRSTPKKYAQMIFRQLERLSDDLGIDNTILKEKQNEELNKLSDDWKVNVGKAEPSNVEFFIDEMIKRINIRQKLLAAHSARLKECEGRTFPAKAELKRVNGIVQTWGVSTEDTLGNGKLDNPLQQVNPNCWALAGLNAFCENDEIKESINSMLLKQDGIISFYLAEADKVYSFTEAEILKGTNSAMVIGDGDAIAIMSAIDSYFKEMGSEDYTDIREGAFTIGKMFELMVGKPASTEQWSVEELKPDELVQTENISARGFETFVNKATNDKPYSGVFCLRKGVEAEKINAYDAFAKPDTIELSSRHAYSFYTADENYVYFKDSNYSDSYIRTPHKIAYHVLDAAIYRYR